MAPVISGRPLVTLLCAAVASGAAAAPAAASDNPRSCGTLYNVVGSRDYKVMASASVSCRFAKPALKRYIQRRRQPSGWSCSRPGGGISHFCRRSGGKRMYTLRR